MKYCPNYRCVAYGRVVYSQATRCVFCRWDLKPPRMKSEDPETVQVAFSSSPRSSETTSESSREHDRQAQAKRSPNPLRQTA